MGEISWLDYVLLPFYLLLIYKFAFFCRDRFYNDDHPYRKYFIPALTAKVAGAIFIGLVYFYYYDGGDTLNFFYHSQVINATLPESPGTWLRLITHQADTSNMKDALALSDMYWYDDTASYTTSCLGAIIGIFCFTKYLVINVIVASLSFTGMWLMFVTFAQKYPQLVKPVAIAILFIPGPIVWGSGLFKDSFCMFSIGSLMYCTTILFEKRSFKPWLVLLSILCVTLIVLIKAYILIALLPVIFLKTFIDYTKRAISTPGNKAPYFITLSIGTMIGLFVLRKATVYLSVLSIQDVLETIKRQKDYLLQVSLATQGSAYDLGDFDPTLGSLLRKFWPAVNVTLFRPYIWESNNVLQLFDALQSAAVLLLTLYVAFSKNIFKTLKLIFQDTNLLMCLLFTLLFAFFVGISTYNFGSLSRYKIPCTPFYVLLLMILLYQDKDAALTKDHQLQEDSSKNATPGSNPQKVN
ncbi:hypothetical protein KHS38_05440 [Mucilaginibacter sp. Bleaf8]|uniref:hypothetical protein n=1 Tax=Mucilaginibacter sp. Bleaf8 TaxID=2834430 RepID=UPI001BCA7DFE|nr:hypothetical protein [Mucilaginibacter sp. Bleaf8]MBS7563840.1 hypothetical protein [Mucilaginibacter sp. Bleaf8]